MQLMLLEFMGDLKLLKSLAFSMQSCFSISEPLEQIFYNRIFGCNVGMTFIDGSLTTVVSAR
jgi:hypothetical protein